MQHVAIMKKSWGLTQKILTGEKTIESRWYKYKHVPWGKIGKGDTVYFKDSGAPVTVRAEVEQVLAFSDLTPKKVRQIIEKYGRDIQIEYKEVKRFYELYRNKKYCLLIFLKNPKAVKPFEINKTGFGLMSAWLTVKNIARIKKQ